MTLSGFTIIAAAAIFSIDAMPGEAAADVWLHEFVALADRPHDAMPTVPETERLFGLMVSGDASCPRLLELSPEHPAFVAGAHASMTGSEACEGLRLSLVTVDFTPGTECAPYVVDYFTKAFGRSPQIDHPAPNTDYRWQLAPSRAIVVTAYGGPDGNCSVAFADSVRPPRPVKG